jgi:hypothetical protein
MPPSPQSAPKPGTSLELAPLIGVGVSDLQHAARAEINRIIKETKGNELAQSKLLIGRLRSLGLLKDTDVKVVTRLAEIGHRAGAAKSDARDAYFESRELYNTLLAGGDASPVALVLASSAVGSYTIAKDPDGSGTVVFKKSSGDWEGRGAAAGAIIGSFWGPGGAAIGGAVGGLVGHAVDECTED